MTHEIKLAVRSLKLKLNTEQCKVKLSIATGEYITEPGLINENYVHIKQFSELVNIRNISEIEIPVSRFTPDKKCWIKIGWDN